MSWRFGSDDFPFRLDDLLIPLSPRLEALAQSAKVRVPGSHVAFFMGGMVSFTYETMKQSTNFCR